MRGEYLLPPNSLQVGDDVNNSEMKPAERENANNKTLHVFIPEFLHAAAETAGPGTSYRCR